MGAEWVQNGIHGTANTVQQWCEKILYNTTKQIEALSFPQWKLHGDSMQVLCLDLSERMQVLCLDLSERNQAACEWNWQAWGWFPPTSIWEVVSWFIPIEIGVEWPGMQISTNRTDEVITKKCTVTRNLTHVQEHKGTVQSKVQPHFSKQEKNGARHRGIGTESQ